MTDTKMIDVRLARIVMRSQADRHYIFLEEIGGDTRGFSIVIGTPEADEIYRVVHKIEPQRPLTHQLAHTAIGALGAQIRSIDIVALQHNTYYAQIELKESGGSVIRVDARPSDAIAIGLRAGAKMRVAESVMLDAIADLASDEQKPGEPEQPGPSIDTDDDTDL